jgi:acyl carrier protein
VAEEAELRRALRIAQAEFGEITGVLHLAGVPGAGLIQVKDRGTVETVFRPKVQGTRCLDRVLEEFPHDFLLLFSSLVVFTGGIGQLDYCAANAYLGAFARARSARGLPTVTIDWCSWRWDAWSQALLGFDPAIYESFRQSRELYGLDFEEGARAMVTALASGLPQIAVSTQELTASSSGEIDVAKVLEALAARDGSALHERPNLGVEFVAPETETERFIASVWQEYLGIDGVGVHDNFFQLGGHSLLGVRLLSRLREKFSKEVALSSLFEHPTVRKLAAFVESTGEAAVPVEAGGEIPRARRRSAAEVKLEELSDSQVDRMLAELAESGRGNESSV